MLNILKLFFPDNYSCLVCSRDIFNNPYLICEVCNKMLPTIKQRICLHCGEPLVSEGNYCKRCKGTKFFVDRAISPFYYDGDIINIIYDLKYNGKKYTGKCLAKYMADCFIKSKLYADVIIPVPLCEERFKQRGYNQSEILGEELSKLTGIKMNVNILKRIKQTPTQTNLTYIERQKNLKDAFKAYKIKYIKDKTVLLIDDVYTTGATLKECAKVLKSAGVKCVYALTAAHTLLNTGDKNE